MKNSLYQDLPGINSQTLMRPMAWISMCPTIYGALRETDTPLVRFSIENQPRQVCSSCNNGAVYVYLAQEMPGSDGTLLLLHILFPGGWNVADTGILEELGAYIGIGLAAYLPGQAKNCHGAEPSIAPRQLYFAIYKQFFRQSK